MKILMFGWEYSPQYSGGLGVVCRELSDSISKNHHVTFVLPKIAVQNESKSVTLKNVSEVEEEDLNKILDNRDISFLDITSNLIPYIPPKYFKKEVIGKNEIPPKGNNLEILKSIPLTGKYNDNLVAEVTKYTLSALAFYQDKKFDVIHAHDWMGINAGVLAKKILKVPMIAHVHSTEYDRNGAGGHENIKSMEKAGLESADAIICVSQKTKNDIVSFYQIPENKIEVIPNATDWSLKKPNSESNEHYEIGFLGRMTHQKGPEKFVDLARELVNNSSDFRFTMIGEGYLDDYIRQKAEKLNLTSKFRFTGFLEKEDVKKELKKLSLLVIPSVSEPFGLVAIEATASGVPVLISENSGVSEYIPFKTFRPWDIHTVKTQVKDLMENPDASQQYIISCQESLKKLTWTKSASEVENLYNDLVNERST